jgi:hypothetical protein
MLNIYRGEFRHGDRNGFGVLEIEFIGQSRIGRIVLAPTVFRTAMSIVASSHTASRKASACLKSTL